MARDKLYEARMQGMLYAYNKAKEEGIEALSRDIKKRNITKMTLTASERDMDYCFNQLSKNLYNNSLTAVAYTLHDSFGFGKKRLHEFKKAFDKTVEATYDLDYIGEHYVRLEDYAIEMNEKYDLGINAANVAVCQDLHDKDDPRYRMCKVERVIEELRAAGFKDAAEFIDKKLQ